MVVLDRAGGDPTNAVRLSRRYLECRDRHVRDVQRRATVQEAASSQGSIQHLRQGSAGAIASYVGRLSRLLYAMYQAQHERPPYRHRVAPRTYTRLSLSLSLSLSLALFVVIEADGWFRE